MSVHAARLCSRLIGALPDAPPRITERHFPHDLTMVSVECQQCQWKSAVPASIACFIESFICCSTFDSI